jgi:hypothetical protein
VSGGMLVVLVLLEIALLAWVATRNPKPSFHQLTRWPGPKNAMLRYKLARKARVDACEKAHDDYTRRHMAGTDVKRRLPPNACACRPLPPNA